VPRVTGAGGRGVVVVTTDRQGALEDLQWLRSQQIPAATPDDEGLVRLATPRPDQDDPDPFAHAERWAVALRRAAVASAGGQTVCVANGYRASMPRQTSPRDVAAALDRPARPRVAIFGGAWVGEDEPEYREALRLGRGLAERGIEVVNGGYGGIMAAVSRGAAEAGGTVVGVTITSFSEQVPVNRWLTLEVEAADLFARLPVICDAEAWVAFPGGVGTLSEVALCWNLIQTDSLPSRPLVIVGERWDRALRTFRELLVAEGAHFDLIRPAQNTKEALRSLKDVLP
jgi:uncharacterized protein (TIGR00730 family)